MISNNVCRRVGNGESSFHIIADLLKHIERDAQSEVLSTTCISQDTVFELDSQLDIKDDPAEPEEREASLTGHFMALTSAYPMEGTPNNDMSENPTG